MADVVGGEVMETTHVVGARGGLYYFLNNRCYGRGRN